MGKYIRKNKKGGEVSPLGVLTRAKALALKRVPPAAAEVVEDDTGNGGDGGSYLELRSRRLVKPFSVLEGRKQKNGVPKNPNPKDCLDGKEMDENQSSCCGENLLEFEGRKRTTRESTPCSFIRDSDNIQTPGSSTRLIDANEANSRQAIIPTAREMDAFFARAEEQQVKKFIEKYNFDPVNEKPLPGRYEWVKVDC